MARILKTSWTPDQIERFKKLAASGASAIRLAAAFNRPVAGIRQRARELGIEIKTLRQIRAKMREADLSRERG